MQKPTMNVLRPQALALFRPSRLTEERRIRFKLQGHALATMTYAIEDACVSKLAQVDMYKPSVPKLMK